VGDALEYDGFGIRSTLENLFGASVEPIVKMVTRLSVGNWESAALLISVLLVTNLLMVRPTFAAEVSSGTSWHLDKYRAPKPYSLPNKRPSDIVGIGIAGSNDRVYIWYKDGTVSSGTSQNLGAYRPPYRYELPEGKTPDDIVGIGIAGSNDRVYVWYRDGTVSSGTSQNLGAYRSPYRYELPEGKAPDDIVGIGIAGSNDRVYVWYRDGSVSSGTSRQLYAYRQPYRYSLPRRQSTEGISPDDIVGVGIAGSNDHVYAWYRNEER